MKRSRGRSANAPVSTQRSEARILKDQIMGDLQGYLAGSFNPTIRGEDTERGYALICSKAASARFNPTIRGEDTERTMQSPPSCLLLTLVSTQRSEARILKGASPSTVNTRLLVVSTQRSEARILKAVTATAIGDQHQGCFNPTIRGEDTESAITTQSSISHPACFNPTIRGEDTERRWRHSVSRWRMCFNPTIRGEDTERGPWLRG